MSDEKEKEILVNIQNRMSKFSKLEVKGQKISEVNVSNVEKTTDQPISLRLGNYRAER